MQQEEDSPGLFTRHIAFVRGVRDHMVFKGLERHCRTALIVFFNKLWREFEIAQRAAVRSAEYAPFLQNLTMPREEQWYPGWVLHWQIARGDNSGADPHEPRDFTLQVLMLQKLD